MKTTVIPAAGCGLSSRVLVLIAAAAGALALGGCSTQTAVRVKLWQRNYLADSMMDPNRDPIATEVSEHIYFSREAAQGGSDTGGGGCGCN